MGEASHTVGQTCSKHQPGASLCGTFQEANFFIGDQPADLDLDKLILTSHSALPPHQLCDPRSIAESLCLGVLVYKMRMTNPHLAGRLRVVSELNTSNVLRVGAGTTVSRT